MLEMGVTAPSGCAGADGRDRMDSAGTRVAGVLSLHGGGGTGGSPAQVEGLIEVGA